MTKTEDRLKAIELAKQGYSKSEIAKKLNVSRQTIYGWLKEEKRKDQANKGERDKADADTILEQAAEKYDKIASDLVEKTSNEIYGQIILRALAKHGIFIDGHIYDRIDQYINRYNTDDLEDALELAQKLMDMGLELSDLMPGIDQKDMQYFPVFLKFLKMPDVEKTIDLVVKNGISRPDAIFSILYRVILEWRYMGMFKDRLNEIGDSVASNIADRTSSIVNDRIADLENRSIERMDQTLDSFQAIATESFEKTVEEEMNKLNMTLNERNRLMEDIHEKQDPLPKPNEKENRPKNLIGEKTIGSCRMRPDSS